MTSRVVTAAVALTALLASGCQRDAVPDRDIIYTSSSDAQREQIWRMRPDGSEARPLTTGTEGLTESFAVWSPDGATIAFMSNRHQPGEPVSAIFVMDADGSNIRKVGPDDIPFQVAPDFSPDGTKIVFTGGASPSAGGVPSLELYVMNADGTGLRQMTSLGAFKSCPRWSPDGARILVAKDADELLVVDAASGAVTEILPANLDGACGDWSPDGSKLAFASGPDGQLPSISEARPDRPPALEIHVLDLSTGEVTRYPQAGQRSNYPRWSRDGRSIVYQCLVPPGETPGPDVTPSTAVFEICAMAADGSAIRRLTSNTVLDVHPNW